MLHHLHIKNFIIVDELALEFGDHLNVLTGETGAGKSIWIDALSLVLGNRNETSVVSHHAERCEITAHFSVKKNRPAQFWLQEHELLADDDCVLRRIITRDNQSRSFINGTPCPQNLVRELADYLVSIHSQHQHQHLLKKQTQQQLLDNYANALPLLDEVGSLYTAWKTQQQQLTHLLAQTEKREHELQLLEYQYKEIVALHLKPTEWEELHAENQRLHQAQQIISALNHAIMLATDNEQTSAIHVLHQIQRQIATIKHHAPSLQNIDELLQTASIHLQEANDELLNYRNNLQLDPDRLQHIEQRLATIHDIARKHHVDARELPFIEKSLQQKIHILQNSDAQISELQNSIKTLSDQYQMAAAKLSAIRQQAAIIFNEKITQQLQLLGMAGSQFLAKLDRHEDPHHPSGNERIAYLIATNPGQTPQPLEQIVSGGELSRLSLAIQVLAAATQTAATLIFDEVDTGIGGKTAAIVGTLLRELGEQRQVLCITHLPQVAAYGHHHYKAQKKYHEGLPSTEIIPLNNEERIDELARMLAGNEVTEQARAHARALIV